MNFSFDSIFSIRKISSSKPFASIINIISHCIREIGLPNLYIINYTARRFVNNIYTRFFLQQHESHKPVWVKCLQIWSLQWRHNGRDCVSNHQPHHYLLNRLFRRRSKKTSKLRVTGLCACNSPVTGELHTQRASNVENVSIWWRHHG